MPRRKDERPRVLGPYWIESKGYYRVTEVVPRAADPKDRRTDRYFDHERDAQEHCEITRASFDRLEGTTIGEAITSYLAAKGGKERSRIELERRLRLFFDTDTPVARLTATKAEALYERFREGRSVDYHRNTLGNARGFLAWCVRQGIAAENALAQVTGVGERTAGKEQLTGDEARRFYQTGLKMAAQGDDGALGAIVLLALGTRQSEVSTRLVRDLDLDGTVLRISRGKTRKATRALRVPPEVTALLLELVEGRQPHDLLFEGRDGRQHTKAWLYFAVRRVCDAAGVPRVCPHGLRGTHATLSLKLGESVLAVADSLGHEDARTTTRHYAEPGAGDDAAAARAASVIRGDNRGDRGTWPN